MPSRNQKERPPKHPPISLVCARTRDHLSFASLREKAVAMAQAMAPPAPPHRRLPLRRRMSSEQRGTPGLLDTT